jgi:glycosylphosphatidylinositol phospholipase D
MPPLAPHACVLLALAGSAAAALAQGDPLAEPFPPVFQLSDLLPASGGDGSLGFVLFSSRLRDGIGIAVDTGDVDGDGIDDVLCGAQNESRGGSAFVIFGSTEPWPASFDVRSTPTPALIEVYGCSFGTRYLGGALASGDVNGDGLDDFVVGARGSTPDPGAFCDWSGNAFAVLGRERDAWPARLCVESQPGVFPGCVEYASVGTAIGVGDFNGDGIDDSVVSTPRTYDWHSGTPASATVYLGSTSPLARPLATIEAAGSGTDLGRFAAFVGDVNGDGLEDVAITEPDHPGGSRAYIIFGGASGRVLVDDLTPQDGVLLEQDGWFAGSAWYANVGDVNGDGRDDLGFGRGGAIYVVYGRAAADPPLPFPLRPADFDGALGFVITGEQGGSGFGWPIEAAGDVDGDGVGDMVVGATDYDARGTFDVGAAYLIYGRRGGFPASTPVADHPRTVRFEGVERNDRTGSRLGSGDINGDGVPDLIIAAPGADDPSDSGRVYVVYGRDVPCPADLDADGALTIFDFLAFQNLFDAMDPRADFDGDDAFTIFDFLAFQNAFDAGC